MAQPTEENHGPIIWSYTGSIVFNCGCGSPIPIVLPYHQGLSPTSRCRACQSTFQLKTMSVTMGDSSKDQFEIMVKPHMMIEAASQMPDLPPDQVLNGNVTPFGPLKR